MPRRISDEAQRRFAINREGLGNYIHFRTWRYRAYGINLSETHTYSSFNQSLTRQSAQWALRDNHAELLKIVRGRNIRQANAAKASALETYLNNFIYAKYTNIPTADGTNVVKINQEQQALFAQNMQAIVEKNFPQLGAQWANMNFNLNITDGIQSFQKLGQLKYNGVLQVGYITSKTFDKITKNIQTLLDRIRAAQDLLGGDNTISENSDKFNKIQQLNVMYEQVQELQKQFAQELEGQYRMISKAGSVYGYQVKMPLDSTMQNLSYSQRLQQLKASTSYTSVGALLQQYNSCVKTLKTLSQIVTSNDYGVIGEQVFAGIFSIGAGAIANTVDDLEDIIDESIVGTKGSGIFYNNMSSLIDMRVVATKFNKIDRDLAKQRKKNTTNKSQTYVQTNQLTGHKTLRTTVSPDTVDISITFADDSDFQKILNTDKLNASVKNIRDLSGISILGGAPLEAVLNLATTDFANHYLNILATEKSFNKYPNVEEEIYFLAAIRGLTGYRGSGGYKSGFADTYQTENADYFVVNNHNHQNNGRQVKVWATSDLINKFNNLNTIKEYITIDALPKSLDNAWVNANNGGKKFAAAIQRISDILGQLHAYKLKVTLNAMKL